ncbi:MAG TPA: hypothetical protein VIB00_17970 [Pyrinomonadaceae bacterium]|jgi:hypothetical protein
MKRCPSCNRTYTDLSLNFCLEDGTPLVGGATTPVDPQATVRYPSPRDTGDPPATEIYNQPIPLLNQVPEMSAPRPQWTPGSMAAPMAAPRKKSNTVWWVLGGLAVVGVIGVGLVIMLIALASIGSSTNENTNTNINRIANRNNSNNGNISNTNSAADLPSSVVDDFSYQKWGSGNSRFGDIWYADDEYHMRSKEKTYLVMYAPSNEYNTQDATVKVTARSVDGSAATSGYGLIVHGEKTKDNQLEDYALLIYTGDDPQYEIVKHKNGNQTALIPWTRSSVIRSGTSPNQLEVRIKGDELSFYINGQYVNRISDNENFRRGLVGFYTSDTAEVAFDDLEVKR